MFNILYKHLVYLNVKAKANTAKRKGSKDVLISQKRLFKYLLNIKC